MVRVDAHERHGGNLAAASRELGRPASTLLDASASLVPFAPGLRLRLKLAASALTWKLRAYPDRELQSLRAAIARHHNLDPAWVLPGNGAAELITWAGRDAAAAGISALPAPGFSDYSRALACWEGASRPWLLPLHWNNSFPQPLPEPPEAEAIWITNPHNPTGQLWSRDSLDRLLDRHRLVICDEAFLPLVAGGEAHSLIPRLGEQPRLVVLRSLTKLYGLAGLRLGYALGHPDRLMRWQGWRDPWPVNNLAAAIGEHLLRDDVRHQRHCNQVQRWCSREGHRLACGLNGLDDRAGALKPLPSAANYLLVHSERSLLPLRRSLAERHGILVRDCRSFEGLDARWLRISLQDRRGNLRLLKALRREWTSLTTHQE
ncbi:MAG: aminotransferase class I/II-fold pyridoxal phosphate-dependent enzyme [Cyanobacteriota bacterium]|nr:aminotransferase class I/II-fold pyridoxal phosphate-dependent enzyme [Cyanobacteriota bacterium]